MLPWKFKIWINTLKEKSPAEINKVRTVLTFIALFILIVLFAIRITDTIDNGLKAQERTEKLAQEVKALEQQNEDLKYKKELYGSESQIESEYRALENKKKEGEKIYIINFPEHDEKKKDAVVTPTSEAVTDKTPNWQLWMEKIFKD
jgi:hypothetical protein